MIRTIAVGFVLFVVFAVAFAPASLIRTVIPADADVELLSPAGTLWNGSGELYLGGQPAGRVRWDFRAVTILQGKLGYDVSLHGQEHRLTGSAAVGLDTASATLSGTATAAFANRWLAPYDIVIGGGLTLEDIEVRLPWNFRRSGSGNADGTVAWEGGAVRYRLSGRDHAGTLPPLVGYLGDGLEAVVYPRDGQTPLLHVELLPDGFARIGMTMLLTRLVGNPWPGSLEDHEVVLEVEEQLF